MFLTFCRNKYDSHGLKFPSNEAMESLRHKQNKMSNKCGEKHYIKSFKPPLLTGQRNRSSRKNDFPTAEYVR